MGKVLTVIFAIPAISMSTITYIYCGNMVKAIVKITIVSFEVRILKRRVIRKLNLKTFCMQLCVCNAFILMLSGFSYYSQSMNLSLVDSFYFNMVTLLTIGFGDIVFDLEYMVGNVHVFLMGNIAFIFGLGTLASLIASLCDLRYKEVPLTDFLKKSTRKVMKPTKIELGKINEVFAHKRSLVIDRNSAYSARSKETLNVNEPAVISSTEQTD